MPQPDTWKRLEVLHHDQEAPYYDALIGREYAPYQRTHTAEPWARLLAASGAELVLDVGAGTGRTSLAVAAAGPAVIALDTSAGMLRVARTKAQAQAVLGVRPLQADGERLPLPDASVDGVVCQGVLHHLPDVGHALAEADRVLVPGGWLCLAEPGTERSRIDVAVRRGVEILRPYVGRAVGRHSPATAHERPLDPEALLGPLRARGYTIEAEYLDHPPYVYRYLPAALSRALARAINHGDRRRRRRADLIVVRARKPDARSPVACNPTADGA